MRRFAAFVASAAIPMATLGFSTLAWAQSAPASAPDPTPTRNPVSIEAELNQIDEARESRVPLPGLDRVFKPWYDGRTALDDRVGLRLGLAWTGLYQIATDSLTGEDQASGGIFDLFGAWSLVDRGGSHPGTLGFRVEDRHRLWNDVAPQSLFVNIGTGTPTATGYSDFDLSLVELWYEQEIVKDRFTIRVGKMLPFGYYDFFLFKNPKTDFTDASFALNPTIAWPRFGLGAATEIRPREDIYVLAGIHDANGEPTRSGFDSFFDDKEYFVIAELGWDPGYLSNGTTNPAAPDFHVTVWHTDARKKAGRPDGWGFSFTGQKRFGDLTPFLRYGYSDGGVALLEHLVMAGVAWTNAFNYEQDTVGLGLSYGRPSRAGFVDQFTTELYYRVQVTRRLAVGPSVQLIVNPAANPDRDVMGVFGLRVQFGL